jgi:hypothetical protein
MQGTRLRRTSNRDVSGVSCRRRRRRLVQMDCTAADSQRFLMSAHLYVAVGPGVGPTVLVSWATLCALVSVVRLHRRVR